MRKVFYSIFITFVSFFCINFINIPCFATNNSFTWGQDVLSGSNGSVDINSLLGDTYSFESLYGPGFIVGVSNAYDELNNQLYDKFGWDLDDAGQKIIDIASGGDELGLALNVLANTINSPATDILSGGYQLFQFVRSGGAKSLVLGIADNVNNTITSIKGNLLNQITANDISNINSAIDDLYDDDTFLDMSDTGILYIDHVYGEVDTGNIWYRYSVKTEYPIIQYFDGSTISCFVKASYLSNYSMSANGVMIFRQSQSPVSAIKLDDNIQTYTINGVEYISGILKLYYDSSWYTIRPGLEYYPTKQEIIDFLGSLSNENAIPSYNYHTGVNYNALMQLLNSLQGHWVSSQDMATIRDYLDGGVISRDDTTGELTYDYTDSLVSELTDIINGLLEKSIAIEQELDGVIDDSGTVDPNPVPDDNNTGIDVPADFPIDSFGTFNEVITSPFQFFSVFEPIFLIFGSSTLLITGLWLFVPCVIVIAFIISALK